MLALSEPSIFFMHLQIFLFTYNYFLTVCCSIATYILYYLISKISYYAGELRDRWDRCVLAGGSVFTVISYHCAVLLLRLFIASRFCFLICIRCCFRDYRLHAILGIIPLLLLSVRYCRFVLYTLSNGFLCTFCCSLIYFPLLKCGKFCTTQPVFFFFIIVLRFFFSL